jgi:putative ABC transport system permease protein
MWMRALARRDAVEREMEEEMRQHIDRATARLMARGLSRSDAQALAKREFGNVTAIAEQGREVWRLTWVEDFLLDIRFASRQLRRSPAFAIAGALTLALGIGANTAVFAVVETVILRPLPFPNASRLVSVVPRNKDGPGGTFNISYPNFFDFRSENRVFGELVSYRSEDFSLTGMTEPIQIHGEIVASDLFPLLGVKPMLGRGFLRSDEAAGVRTAIVSYAIWKTVLGGDPGVVGRAISLGREPYVVVGVAPPGFNFPIGGEQVGVWTPLATDARSATTHPVTEQRGARMLSVVARLRDGVSIEQAQAQMAGVAASLARRYPDENKRYPSVVLRPLLDDWIGPAREALLVLLGAVGLVLLLACANIANLLLSRTAEREREFAVRTAIGAGRSRLVRQVVAESVTLSVAGGMGGVVSAGLLLRVVVPLGGAIIPRITEATIDFRVLAFSLAVTAATALLFSLVPVARLARHELHDALGESGRGGVHGSDRLRSVLVVVQVSLGLTLVSAAALLTASYVHVARRNPGLDAEQLLTFSVSPPASKYSKTGQPQFYDELLDRIRNLPGAPDAAAAMPLPLTGSSMTVGFEIEGQPANPGARPSANMAIVSPRFLSTAGIPLVAGREFTDQDRTDSPPVLMVNRAFADKFFPGQDAVGKRMKPGVGSDARGPRTREIVGVIGDARQSPLSADDDPVYYVPYRQLPWCCPSVMVRAAGAPTALAPEVRSVVASIDKQLPIYDVSTGERMLAIGLAAPKFLMLLLSSFAAVGLLLTVVGLYGVMSYDVVRRTREIGVRMALGASQFSVLSMVLRRAMTLVTIGAVLGAGGAVAGTRLMRTIVFGIGTWQPLLVGISIAVVIAAALTATYLPARRAASVDPTLALRSE